MNSFRNSKTLGNETKEAKPAINLPTLGMTGDQNRFDKIQCHSKKYKQ
jgi:hypothetical protein